MTNDMLGIPYNVHTTVRQWNNISTTGTDRAEDCIIDLDDVWYDADGNGAGASVLIATLTGVVDLAAGDFVIVA